MFWHRINTNPTPNSTAEKTRKKKLNESTLRLSKQYPKSIAIPYKVIHRISAIINKCKEVFEFKRILKNININKQNNKEISFKIIFFINRLDWLIKL